MTYLALLVAVAVVSGVIAASAQVASHRLQRQREIQLLWAGDQIRRALTEYARYGNGLDSHPLNLADLLEDRRQAVMRRHLRRVYFDPITGRNDWGLVLNAQGRIVGVHSKSTLAPIRRTGFPLPYEGFAGSRTYAEWKFEIAGQRAATAAPVR